MRTWIVAGAVATSTATAAAQPANPTTAPPAELIAAAKAQVGTYRCKGTVVVDGDRRRAVSARLVIELALDGHWLVWRLTQHRTRGVSHPLGYLIYRWFDAGAATWRALQLDSTGGRAELVAVDGRDWIGTLVSGGVSVGIRDHQEPIRGGLRLWGEYELEPGLFEPGYDVTCKR